MKQLRPYQRESIQALWKFWKDFPQGDPLIVAPTGSGKSQIIAHIIRQVSLKYPRYTFLVVSHRKEIIAQNARAISEALDNEPVGIFSAGLGQKNFRRITCANVQSIYKRDLSATQMLIVDECHLISGNSKSMYQTLIKKTVSDHTKIVGLTATPYRMDRGSLVGDDGVFDDICYDISIPELIEKKFLSNIVSIPSKNEMDLTEVKMSGFDYNQTQLQEVARKYVSEQIDDMIKKGKDRRHWLIFSTGIKHAEEIAEELNNKGVKAEYITGEMISFEREAKLNRFKKGETRALVNCDILTTGFDYPSIDLIAIIRPTKSTSLYVQMVGRGMRIAENKKDCLLLDYGGNIRRHGPIDCIQVKKRKSKNEKAEIGVAPSKECPGCGAIIAARYTHCPSCDHEFPKVDLTKRAEEDLSPIAGNRETFEKTIIESVEYTIHRKEGKESFKITYKAGMTYISDFLCFDHRGYAMEMAFLKWYKLGGQRIGPTSTKQAFERQHEIKVPHEVLLEKKNGFWKIKTIFSFKEGIAPQTDWHDELFEKTGINI